MRASCWALASLVIRHSLAATALKNLEVYPPLIATRIRTEWSKQMRPKLLWEDQSRDDVLEEATLIRDFYALDYSDPCEPGLFALDTVLRIAALYSSGHRKASLRDAANKWSDWWDQNGEAVPRDTRSLADRFLVYAAVRALDDIKQSPRVELFELELASAYCEAEQQEAETKLKISSNAKCDAEKILAAVDLKVPL